MASLLSGLVLAACGGGGGGGGGSGSLSISLSPASVAASFYQGTPYQFSETANVQGSASGDVYVEIFDSTGTIQPGASITQQPDGSYLASITTMNNLTPGTRSGALQVAVCGEESCSQPYTTASLPFDFTVLALPTVTAIVPSSVPAGQGVTITVNGTNFATAASVRLNGNALTTTFVSPTQLTAVVYDTDIPVAGAYPVFVSDGGSGNSNVVALTVDGPTLTSLSPSSATVGSPGFTLTASGSDFIPSSTLQFDGNPLPTTFISATQLTARVGGDALATASSDPVVVINGDGGAVSNTATFNVDNLVPSLISVTPTMATTGDPGLTLKVSGGDFVSGSTVLWNGMPRTTTFVSTTSLTAQITSLDLANGGTIPVSVSNPAPGGGSSSAATFTVTNPAPVLAAINATSATVGCSAFTLYAEGSNFVPNSVVQWNGSPRSTTYVSSTLLTAQILATDVGASGVASVRISSPVPGGGKSTGSAFTIAPTGVTTDAVAYQINPAHSGVATTTCPVSIPTAPLWSVNLGAFDGPNQSYALIAEGLVFATLGTTQLYALDQSTGAVVWGPVSIAAGSAGTAYDADALFVAGYSSSSEGVLDGQMSAINATTGVPLWSTPFTNPNENNFSSGVTAANGFAYTSGFGTGGDVYAVNESTGAIAWNAGVGGETGDPAVTPNGVYVSEVCPAIDLAPASGALNWNSENNCNSGNNTMAVANGVAFSPNYYDEPGLEYDASTGAIMGNLTSDNLPAIGASVAYFVQSGVLNAISMTTNKTVWSFQPANALFTSPILVNDVVFVGSDDGSLYALDANTGQQLGVLAIPGGMASGHNTTSVAPSLAAGGGLLVVPSQTSLYAYRLSGP